MKKLNELANDIKNQPAIKAEIQEHILTASFNRSRDYCVEIEKILNNERLGLSDSERKTLNSYQDSFIKYMDYFTENKLNSQLLTMQTIDKIVNSHPNFRIFVSSLTSDYSTPYQYNQALTHIVDIHSGYYKYQLLLKALTQIMFLSIIAGIVTLSLTMPLEIGLPLLIGGFVIDVLINMDFVINSATNGPSLEDQSIMQNISTATVAATSKYSLWKEATSTHNNDIIIPTCNNQDTANYNPNSAI